MRGSRSPWTEAGCAGQYIEVGQQSRGCLPYHSRVTKLEQPNAAGVRDQSTQPSLPDHEAHQHSTRIREFRENIGEAGCRRALAGSADPPLTVLDDPLEFRASGSCRRVRLTLQFRPAYLVSKLPKLGERLGRLGIGRRMNRRDPKGLRTGTFRPGKDHRWRTVLECGIKSCGGQLPAKDGDTRL